MNAQGVSGETYRLLSLGCSLKDGDRGAGADAPAPFAYEGDVRFVA